MSGPRLQDRSSISLHRARQACPSDSEGHFRRDVLVTSFFPEVFNRRDVLVTSAFPRWTIHPFTSGTTGVPLRFGGTFSEGRTCHVRLSTLDNPSLHVGRDKRASPIRRDLLVKSGVHWSGLLVLWDIARNFREPPHVGY